jgi:hypothetical protein
VSAAPASQSATNFLYQFLRMRRSSFSHVDLSKLIALGAECPQWVENGPKPPTVGAGWKAEFTGLLQSFVAG